MPTKEAWNWNCKYIVNAKRSLIDELGDEVGHEPLEVEAAHLLVSAPRTLGTNELQFEAASCKGRVERLSASLANGWRRAHL